MCLFKMGTPGGRNYLDDPRTGARAEHGYRGMFLIASTPMAPPNDCGPLVLNLSPFCIQLPPIPA